MQSVQNILRVYHQASAGEIDGGLRWYLHAHEEAIRLSRCETRAVGVRECAAIIAAVSPGLRWERNIATAERIIQGEGLEGLGVRWYDGVKKAKRILAGENPETVLQGNKVRSFWDNLARPTLSDKVTIDGHAWAIREGVRSTLDNTPAISDSLYSRIEEDYTSAADVVGIRPLQLQAITWCTWRRLHGVASGHYLPLFGE